MMIESLLETWWMVLSWLGQFEFKEREGALWIVVKCFEVEDIGGRRGHQKSGGAQVYLRKPCGTISTL